MRVKAHIRVAKNGQRAQVDATLRPSRKPLTNSRGDELPTIAFAVMLDVPDAMFRRAEQVIAELTIDPKFAQIAADVRQVPA